MPLVFFILGTIFLIILFYFNTKKIIKVLMLLAVFSFLLSFFIGDININDELQINIISLFAEMILILISLKMLKCSKESCITIIIAMFLILLYKYSSNEITNTFVFKNQFWIIVLVLLNVLFVFKYQLSIFVNSLVITIFELININIFVNEISFYSAFKLDFLEIYVIVITLSIISCFIKNYFLRSILCKQRKLA